MRIQDALNSLGDMNQYVFHGSGSELEELEPRQAHTMVDDVRVPDGEPAVFASPFLDYAIFMALINKVTCPDGFRSGTSHNNDKLTFRATQETLDQLNENTKGYVHVFNKSDFIQRNNAEWVSYKKVKPVKIFEVYLADFKPEIKVIK